MAHDAPVGVPEIASRLVGSANQWGAADLEYAQACREVFTKAGSGVQPDLLLHGHYHFPVAGRWVHPDTGHVTRVFGLGMDGDLDYALGALDRDYFSAKHLSVNHSP
ncbi:hypothetical protein ACNI3K_00515 [Demequina sp. SO4-13]